jgi:hypothetical protein
MGSKRTPRTIALDFDGVLHSYRGYNGGLIAGPIPGALESVHKLQAAGHTVVVFSTRPRDVIAAWLRTHEFPALEVTDTKLKFFVIVDDRAIAFEGTWSDEFVSRINDFKPYWWANRWWSGG